MGKQAITLDDLADGLNQLQALVRDLYDGQLQMRGDIRALYDSQHELYEVQLALRSDHTGMRTTLNAISNDLTELPQYTESGFDTMSDRFDRLEDRVDRLEVPPGSYYEH